LSRKSAGEQVVELKFKEQVRLNYLASTLIPIFLGTLTSRPLFQRQLSDCIFWNSFSVRGFRTSNSFTSIFQSSVLSWNMQSMFGITSSPKLRPTVSNQFKNVRSVYFRFQMTSRIAALCRRYCQPIHSKKRTLSYFFHSIVHPTSSLHYLCAPPRDS